MSLNTPPTPTLKPTNINNLKNIPPLQNLNNEDEEESQEKTKDNNEIIQQKRESLQNPKTSPELYNKLIKSHINDYKFVTKINNDAMEDINKIKDYKWNLGMILIEKINSLKYAIEEKRNEINKKEKEFEKNNVFDERIKYLKKLIRKEEDEGHPQELAINTNLKEKKQELEDKINDIETKRNDLKTKMKEKYQKMLELKAKLNKSLKELQLVEKQINSRKFIFEKEKDEQEKKMKKEMSEKLFYKDEERLHLSQNIGKYINKTLLINEDGQI